MNKMNFGLITKILLRSHPHECPAAGPRTQGGRRPPSSCGPGPPDFLERKARVRGGSGPPRSPEGAAGRSAPAAGPWQANGDCCELRRNCGPGRGSISSPVGAKKLFATEGHSAWVSGAGGVTAGPVSRRSGSRGRSRGFRTPCTAFCCFPSVEHNFNTHSR